MTLSDPLLKELKGHIAKLVLSSRPGPPYGDDNETVFLLCHCIESIFLKGLIRHDGFTPWRTDSFSWFYQLVRKYHRIIPLSFKLAFEDVLNDPKTRTHVGKNRLLIRNCLKRRCLHVPIQFHVENEDYDDPNLRVNYSAKGSILGHEILSQIFFSLILQLSNYEFNLDLSNASFLDESWQIPQQVKAEFVPCDKLGLTLGFPMGFAVIVNIIENSLAAELGDQIAVGDIMDEFNGTSLRNFYGSKIESLFRKHRYQPFKITFIKATDPKGQLYLPAIKLYRILGLDPEKLTYTKPSIVDLREQNQDTELNVDNTLIDDLPLSNGNQMTNESKSCSSGTTATTTTLIQGLLQEEFDSNKNDKNIRKTSQNFDNETINEIDKPVTSYCDILAELSNPTDLSSNHFNSTSNFQSGGCLLDSEIDLNPSRQGEFEWDSLVGDIESHGCSVEQLSQNNDELKEELNERKEDKSNYPKYFDDSINPCMV